MGGRRVTAFFLDHPAAFVGLAVFTSLGFVATVLLCVAGWRLYRRSRPDPLSPEARRLAALRSLW